MKSPLAGLFLWVQNFIDDGTTPRFTYKPQLSAKCHPSLAVLMTSFASQIRLDEYCQLLTSGTAVTTRTI